jgi:hypothetical protein
MSTPSPSWSSEPAQERTGSQWRQGHVQPLGNNAEMPELCRQCGNVHWWRWVRSVFDAT